MNRKWRRRILVSLFVILVFVLGTWCYDIYLADRALSDICTTEDECRNKRHRVDDEIQKFVGKRKRKHRVDKPDYNVDKSSSNEADQTNTPETHQTTARTHKEHWQRSMSIQTQQKPSLGKERYSVPTIPKLLWWDFYLDGVSSKNDTITCKGGVKCHAVSNRIYASHPDTMAIIHYGTNFNFMDLPKERSPSVVWGLIHEESLKNADFIFNHEEMMTLFNYTATFKRESDYPLTTQFLPNLEYLRSKTYFVKLQDKNKYRKEEKLAPIFYIQSDCNTPSNRDKYVNLLQKYIKVDSYGKCNNNKKLPEYLTFKKNMAPMTHKDFFALGAKYKFTLTMENAVCDDYITEKVWRPFHLGSVPIIFGSPKIKDYLPSKNSAVLVNDFDDIKDLAELIQYLDNNDTAYEEYLHFKERDGITNTYLINELNNREWSKYDDMKRPYWSFFSGFECYICEQIHRNINAINSGKRIHTKIAKLEHYGCPSPKRFNNKGKYIIDDPRYSYHWYEGKYRAKAFRYFYDNNLNFTENSITELSQSLRKEYNENI